MPPTASPNGAKSTAEPDDIGGLIEQEQLPSGRADLPEPLVAHSQRERILNAMAADLRQQGLRRDHDRRHLRARRRLPRHLLRALQGQGGLPAGRDGALARRRDGAHRRGLLARQALGDDGPRRRRHLPRPAREPPRLRPHGAGRGALAAGGRSFEMYASGKRVLQALLDRGRRRPDRGSRRSPPAPAAAPSPPPSR